MKRTSARNLDPDATLVLRAEETAGKDDDETTVVLANPAWYARKAAWRDGESQANGAPDSTRKTAGARTRKRVVGDYELLEELGRGGMGVVYRARQRGLNREVAVKMLLGDNFASGEEVRRFVAEAEVVATLDHPGIVPVFELARHEGRHFFSMGLVEGISLQSRLREGAIPWKEAAMLVKLAAEAVHYAHEQGVVHRDLKPANVMLDATGEPRITDFGLAKRLQADSGMTITGQVMGTPNYMAPEQIDAGRGSVGPATDIYALGAILHACVIGAPAFRASDQYQTIVDVLETDPTPIRRINRHLPKALEAICLKCLDKVPERRYPSALALAEDLGRLLEGEPIEAGGAGYLARVRRWLRQRPVLAAHMVGLLWIDLMIQVRHLFATQPMALHLEMTVTLTAWVMFCLMFQGLARFTALAGYIRYAWFATDALSLTVVLSLASGPVGPLLVAYPVLVGASALWGRPALVGFTTAMCAVGFATLGQIRPAQAGPYDYQIIFGVMLLILGCMMIFLVNRSRTLGDPRASATRW